MPTVLTWLKSTVPHVLQKPLCLGQPYCSTDVRGPNLSVEFPDSDSAQNVLGFSSPVNSTPLGS